MSNRTEWCNHSMASTANPECQKCIDLFHHIPTSPVYGMKTTKINEPQFRTLRETLASYAHESWARGMTHLFSKCTTNANGSMTIPQESVQWWQRQIHTTYSDLTPAEQVSDLEEADKIINIFKET